MENSNSFEDIKELFRETGRRVQETEKLLKELGQETDRRMQETDRRMQETDRHMQETDRKLREVGKQIGGLGNRLGEFVEGIVRPSLVRLFTEWGIEVHQTYRNMEGKRNGLAAEIDLLVVNDTDAVAVEVKSKLETKDVDDHLERLGKFKILFQNLASLRLLGAVAAMVISEEAASYAIDKGLFVIGQKGEDAILLNPPSFQPKAW